MLNPLMIAVEVELREGGLYDRLRDRIRGAHALRDYKRQRQGADQRPEAVKVHMRSRETIGRDDLRETEDEAVQSAAGWLWWIAVHDGERYKLHGATCVAARRAFRPIGEAPESEQDRQLRETEALFARLIAAGEKPVFLVREWGPEDEAALRESRRGVVVSRGVTVRDQWAMPVEFQTWFTGQGFNLLDAVDLLAIPDRIAEAADRRTEALIDGLCRALAKPAKRVKIVLNLAGVHVGRLPVAKRERSQADRERFVERATGIRMGRYDMARLREDVATSR